ncbi:MAG: insulinase family protein [Dehalococcoidia bacterium]|nr:MAG: insulinase family protein [Dehalococcoidia bacterium]
MYRKTVLDNKLRLLTAKMPHTQSVSVSLFIGIGSRYETDTEAGISHFVEHLCFRGTAKRPTAREISAAIEGVGGLLNGGTDKELTTYWCKVAVPHFGLALEVLADMLLNSRFKPQDIEKERRVIVEEIKMSFDFPPQRVGMLIDELLWPEHPLGRDIAGTKKSVNAISRDMMLGYVAGQYRPDNTVVAIAGNIKHEAIVAAVNQALGNWTNQPQPSQYADFQGGLARRFCLETRDIVQAHLCLALPGLSLVHPRRFALDLLNIILGEGMSSRLFTEIRDKRGLAYSIHSCVDHYLDCGSVIVYAGVEPKNLATTIKAILEQLSKLKDEIPEAELTKAKELAKGRLLLRMEDSRNVAGWMGGQEILTRRILTPERVIALINAITAEELKQLAAELLISRQLRLAVVGPVTAEEPLEELLKL